MNYERINDVGWPHWSIDTAFLQGFKKKLKKILKKKNKKN